MEYALRVMKQYFDADAKTGLNPCSNGICSKSCTGVPLSYYRRVLILVLMEYALREYCRDER